MNNNENFSHGYGDYSQQPPQQQFQDYNQQQQFQDYSQQPPQQQQQVFGGRPDEFNHPLQYGRQSSQYGNEYPAEKQNYNYNEDQGENEEGERGIKEFFTKTTVDPYNQEQTEIRTGHVVGAALLTGLVAFGAKKYIDNKKEKQRMQMGNEIGGMVLSTVVTRRTLRMIRKWLRSSSRAPLWVTPMVLNSPRLPRVTPMDLTWPSSRRQPLWQPLL
ncbi:hypothetical protein BX661DRAFT_174927, partial [Kickxella alabastrina]|uniref:uncharacterized protein n=1 Tax=Kickxella alabastrina TaxID=61397 RepID=UPI00221EFA7B